MQVPIRYEYSVSLPHKLILLVQHSHEPEPGTKDANWAAPDSLLRVRGLSWAGCWPYFVKWKIVHTPMPTQKAMPDLKAISAPAVASITTR